MGKISVFSGFLQYLVTIGAITAIAYLAICFFLFLRQRKFIFIPSLTLEKTPAIFNLPYEDIWLQVPANNKTETIHGWWIPATSSKSDLVLLYLHGNRYNMGANIDEMHQYHQMGFDVVSLDYRGYGLSTGNFPREAQIYEDVEIFWDYLIHQRRLNPQNIVVFGHSLGGAIALELARRHPDFAALIVQSSFTSIAEVINRTGKYKLFPINLLLNQRFDSISKVPKLKMPVLFIHGTDDELIPTYMSEKLFEIAPKPKELFIVPGAEHNYLSSVAGHEYSRRILDFVVRSITINN